MISNGNMSLQRGIKYTKNGNYMGKCVRMFYYYLKDILKYLFKLFILKS